MSWNGRTRISAVPPPLPRTAFSGRRPERPRWSGGPWEIPTYTSDRASDRWPPCICGYRPESITWLFIIPPSMPRLLLRRHRLRSVVAVGCHRRHIMDPAAVRRFWMGYGTPSDWKAKAAAWTGRRRRRQGWRPPSSPNLSACREMGSSSITSLEGGAAAAGQENHRLRPGIGRRRHHPIVLPGLLVDLPPPLQVLVPSPRKRAEERWLLPEKIQGGHLPTLLSQVIRSMEEMRFQRISTLGLLLAVVSSHENLLLPVEFHSLPRTNGQAQEKHLKRLSAK